MAGVISAKLFLCWMDYGRPAEKIEHRILLSVGNVQPRLGEVELEKMNRTSNVQHRILNGKRGNRRINQDFRYEYQDG
jgi:hypothetical protein